MRPTGETAAENARRLDEAVFGLRSRTPELSAATGLWAWQRCVLAAALCPVPRRGAGAGNHADRASGRHGGAVPVRRRAAHRWRCGNCAHPLREAARSRSRADAQLPVYTVLVPLFREASVVPELLDSLRALDYPAERLEVMLIVEAPTRRRRRRCGCAALDPHMQVLVVPGGEPRTKPRAIQYALQFAHGDYVVVYDAEDAPEPDQLRRALAALAPAASASAACRRSSTSTTRTRPGSRASSRSNTPRCSIASCRRSSGCGCRCRWAARRTISARRARCRRRLGSLQRDRGRRPRHPPGARRLARRRAGVDDMGGGAADIPHLAGAAHALAQGLDADLSRAHAPPAPAVARARARGASSASRC